MVDFPPREHRITLVVGEQMTARWRETMGTLDIKGGWFPAVAFLDLLGQRRASGIRIYIGRDEKGVMNLVMAATDEDHNDILPITDGVPRAWQDPEDEGILMENAYPCPIFCGGGDGLNGQG